MDIDSTAARYGPKDDAFRRSGGQEWFGGETALHCASGRGHLDTVSLLIELRADVAKTDERGRSFIHISSGSCAALFNAVIRQSTLDAEV
eukprot:Skav204575  [mRNA]  locus=scaffold6526:4:273:+ [translate_table: standard]